MPGGADDLVRDGPHDRSDSGGADRRPDDGNESGCLAVAWFGGSLMLAAAVVFLPIISLSSLACPGGGPDCSPQRALLLLVGSAGGVAIAFAGLVLGLVAISRRWRPAACVLGLVGLGLLAIPIVLLGRAALVGDAWLSFTVAVLWLAVPGIAVLQAARSILRRP